MKELKKLVAFTLIVLSVAFTSCTGESINDENETQIQSVDKKKVKPNTGG